MPNAQREARGVQRDRARGVPGRQPIRQGLQARHIRAGEAEACERPDRRSRPKAFCKDAERDRGKAADDGAEKQHHAGIDAIRQRGQDRDGQHVAEGIAARQKTAFRGTQAPSRHEMLGEVGGENDVRQQVADLSDAHGRD